MQLKKRGFFFILDAAIGLFILIIGAFLIASLYVQAPKPSQVGLLSNDLISFLSAKKIKDLNNPYAGIGGDLWKQGVIKDADNSLLQQIGELYATNKPDIAEKFIQNVSASVVPLQFRYEVWMDNVRLYPRNPSPQHTSSKANTELLLTSKRVTFGFINRTSGQLWGPYKAEVFVWER